jgi:hypothetical protein
MTHSKPFEERFWKFVMPVPFAGCWIWLGYVDKAGYGRISIPYKNKNYKQPHKAALAHKAAYEHFVGLVPEGLELDHKCRTKCCVNPDHLEPVTRKENIRRGDVSFVLKKKYMTQAYCIRGHLRAEWCDPPNKWGRRRCRLCAIFWRKKYQKEQKLAARA